MPGEVGHLCCVYAWRVKVAYIEDPADAEESVVVADSVEAAASSDEPSPPLRLKLVPLNAADNLSISRLMVWSTMRA